MEGVSHSYIDSITQGKTHGGIVALCTRKPIQQLSDDAIIDGGFYVVLEGIEDPYNFAYAIRSLYASGVDGVIVPQDRFKDASGLICKLFI